MALTSGGIDKLDFYRGLEIIPEVRIWSKGELAVYQFHSGDYHRAGRSGFLPGLNLDLVARLADHPYTSEVLDRFEEAADWPTSKCCAGGRAIECTQRCTLALPIG